MAEYTWETRELPILEAVVPAYDADVRAPIGTLDTIARGAVQGLTKSEYLAAVEGLMKDGFLEVELMNTAQGVENAWILRPLPKARRAVGQWPSEDPFDALIAVLDQMIGAAPEGEGRAALERFRDDVYVMGTGVAGVLIANVLTRLVAGS